MNRTLNIIEKKFGYIGLMCAFAVIASLLFVVLAIMILLVWPFLIASGIVVLYGAYCIVWAVTYRSRR